nr:uncharacterized protein LOC107422278 [Ziziphus jujuba var. spinosa]
MLSRRMVDMDSRQWLGELKDAICCAEDLVGEIKSQAFRCKVEEGKSGICILVKTHDTLVVPTVGEQLLLFPDDGSTSICNCILFQEKRAFCIFLCPGNLQALKFPTFL